MTSRNKILLEDERERGSLQERDLDILLALARYRYLSTSHIERLLFPSRRVANRRLAIVSAHGLARRFRRFAIPGHGSAEFVYYLSAAGASEAAKRLERETVPHPKPRDRTPAGMDHLLSLIEVWIAFDLACPGVGLSVESFWPEWEGRQEKKRFVSVLADDTPDLFDPAARISFRPDAAFVLARGEKRSLFFLEVDLQSESIRGSKSDAFEKKFLAYASYRKHGGFKRYDETFTGFRVLSTWTSKPRMHHARSVAARLGLKQLFLFAPFEEATPASVLGNIWFPPGEKDDPTKKSLV